MDRLRKILKAIAQYFGFYKDEPEETPELTITEHGWEIRKDNLYLLIPKRANERVVFNDKRHTNREITLRAMGATAVEGRLRDADNIFIEYKDAFGEGIDLECLEVGENVQVYVSIEKPFDEDLELRFRLKTAKEQAMLGETPLEKTKLKDLRGQTLSFGDGKRTERTYLQDLNKTPLKYDIVNGELFLIRTVPASIFENAKLPIKIGITFTGTPV